MRRSGPFPFLRSVFSMVKSSLVMMVEGAKTFLTARKKRRDEFIAPMDRFSGSTSRVVDRNLATIFGVRSFCPESTFWRYLGA